MLRKLIPPHRPAMLLQSFYLFFFMGLLWTLMDICKLTYSLQRTCVLFPVSAFVFSKNKLKFLKLMVNVF